MILYSPPPDRTLERGPSQAAKRLKKRPWLAIQTLENVARIERESVKNGLNGGKRRLRLGANNERGAYFGYCSTSVPHLFHKSRRFE